MEILLTGASGFLGYKVSELIKSNKKYNLTTIGRSSNNDIICDLSVSKPNLSLKYDLVIHAAGKAHSIPKNKEEEEEFYKVNYTGTKNLLASLYDFTPKLIVFISSVAVYGKDFGEMISESHPLLGNTPYAKSKILAEQEIINFAKINNIHAVVFRLPLITGENPPGNLKSMINAIRKGYYFRIGTGLAKKSMVSSEDVAKLILKLDNNSGIYNLTDGINPSFKEVENQIAKVYNKKIRTMPIFILKILARFGDLFSKFPLNTDKTNKITRSLTFSDKKAIDDLGWSPKSAIDKIK